MKAIQEPAIVRQYSAEDQAKWDQAELVISQMEAKAARLKQIADAYPDHSVAVHAAMLFLEDNGVLSFDACMIPTVDGGALRALRDERATSPIIAFATVVTD